MVRECCCPGPGFPFGFGLRLRAARRPGGSRPRRIGRTFPRERPSERMLGARPHPGQEIKDIPVTEAEWLDCKEPGRMLQFLQRLEQQPGLIATLLGMIRG